MAKHQTYCGVRRCNTEWHPCRDPPAVAETYAYFAGRPGFSYDLTMPGRQGIFMLTVEHLRSLSAADFRGMLQLTSCSLQLLLCTVAWRLARQLDSLYHHPVSSSASHLSSRCGTETTKVKMRYVTKAGAASHGHDLVSSVTTAPT